MQTPSEILCVDDEADIRTVVRASLQAAGFEVRTAHSAESALESLERYGLPHLAVVDIRMPGTSGLELCRTIHGFCDLPVILLTAVDDEPTIVRSINELAEDYIVKPFRPAELAARVRRVLQRLGTTDRRGRLFEIDKSLQIDFVQKVALVDQREVALTPTESKILHVLSRRLGRPVQLEFLLRRVWPMEEVFEDTLRVHMHRLRKKIEPNPDEPRYLFTERSVGYRLGESKSS
ncbi:MAG: response regulator transcription factor [Acidobacteria bacterium]|nr:response regulator transcription factor [Acidobacteriota bacterium]